MKDITVRVDDELHAKLDELSQQEGEPMSVIVRRYVRRGVQADVRTHVPDVPSLARAHEGTGRVR